MNIKCRKNVQQVTIQDCSEIDAKEKWTWANTNLNVYIHK